MNHGVLIVLGWMLAAIVALLLPMGVTRIETPKDKRPGQTHAGRP